MLRSRAPDGTARLAHRSSVRPVTNESGIVLELKERAADRVTRAQTTTYKDAA